MYSVENVPLAEGAKHPQRRGRCEGLFVQAGASLQRLLSVCSSRRTPMPVSGFRNVHGNNNKSFPRNRAGGEGYAARAGGEGAAGVARGSRPCSGVLAPISLRVIEHLTTALSSSLHRVRFPVPRIPGRSRALFPHLSPARGSLLQRTIRRHWAHIFKLFPVTTRARNGTFILKMQAESLMKSQDSGSWALKDSHPPNSTRLTIKSKAGLLSLSPNLGGDH